MNRDVCQHGLDQCGFCHAPDGSLFQLSPAGRPALNYGPHGFMAVATFRYCLGWMTYAVQECVDWLVEQWPNIDPRARRIIGRELLEAFGEDDDARAYGHSYKRLGHDCDRREWQRLLNHIECED